MPSLSDINGVVLEIFIEPPARIAIDRAVALTLSGNVAISTKS
ncbi:hypothetical protein MmTuc01_0199 [Methanosarcina mazei Tuc01]|uniref:Uncharacterized protein n=1 Tax=Methanosarcina mazei Tuc01 TaxID=1236903 RepID=M1P5J9_METMZ|nr:hypothetical protein MmTuc01_0199 [Methanosarcina mazei Tuc01]